MRKRRDELISHVHVGIVLFKYQFEFGEMRDGRFIKSAHSLVRNYHREAPDHAAHEELRMLTVQDPETKFTPSCPCPIRSHF